MLKKTYKKVLMLSLAFALGVSSFISMGGQAEAASVWDMFNRVYKQATGKSYSGSTVKPEQPITQPEQPEQPAQPKPEPQPQPQQPEPQEPVQYSVADKVIASGEKYLGTPYKYGAPYGQTNTFDCSSFTKTVFAENGITLPRSSRQQATVGTPVSKSQLKKGDLIFTSTSYSSNISHVAIYAGNGKVLHTYGPGGVRYDNFKGSWLEKRFITARRVIK